MSSSDFAFNSVLSLHFRDHFFSIKSLKNPEQVSKLSSPGQINFSLLL